MAKKYELIRNEILKEIENTALEGRIMLPPEEELCKKYDISRQTLRKAADMLIMEGLIYRKKGSGCYLTELALQMPSRQVALVIDNDSEYTNPIIIANLYDALKAYGISLHIHTTDNKYNSERNILIQLQHDKPNAIIIKPISSALPNPNNSLINRIFESGTPVFFLEDSFISANSEYCAYRNDYSSGFDLVNFLLSNEHIEIATFLKIDDKAGHIKFKGITDALDNNDCQIIDTNIGWYSNIDINKLRKKTDIGFISSFLENISDTCSCIICQNDEIAYFMSKAVKALNISNNIEVFSYDNTYLSNFGNTNFTSLFFDYGEYCRQLAHNIHSKLTHQELNVIFMDWSKPGGK